MKRLSHFVLPFSDLFSVPTNGCNNGMFPEGLSPKLSLQMCHSVRYNMNGLSAIKGSIRNCYHPEDFILTAVTSSLSSPVWTLAMFKELESLVWEGCRSHSAWNDESLRIFFVCFRLWFSGLKTTAVTLTQILKSLKKVLFCVCFSGCVLNEDNFSIRCSEHKVNRRGVRSCSASGGHWCNLQAVVLSPNTSSCILTV